MATDPAFIDKLVHELRGVAWRGVPHSPDELRRLLAFVVDLHPRNVLEVGVSNGCTLWAWAQIATGRKVGIDLPSGLPGAICRSRWWKRQQVFKPRRDVTILEVDSHNTMVPAMVSVALKGELVDWLFIDGDHSAKGVADDFRMYRPFVRPGGWIGFHDIKSSPEMRAVNCFVSEFWATLPGEKIEFCDPTPLWGVGLVHV